jgi:two-component system chemotaxis response regulator CheY
MRTLVVEDDFSSRLLLQTYLSKYGECHIAVNGREAIEAFRAGRERMRPYNLICMDIMMPEVDGLTALREIRALEEQSGILAGAGVKIIMTTAMNDSKHVLAAFNGLCDFYLSKPVEISMLLHHLRACKLLPAEEVQPVGA